THASTTDPDARLARKGKGQEAKLFYTGHVLMENRNGLAVGGCVLPASGYAERAAALELLGALDRDRRLTLGADKGYDTRDFVAAVRLLGVTPHVAQNTGHRRRSAIDDRTTRHAGYAVSQQRRKRVEEIFGWLKTIGLMRKTRHRGTRRVDWMFTFALAAYNLVRIRTLTTQSVCPTGHRFRASRTVSPRPAIRGAGRLLCVLPLAQRAAGAPRGEQKCCRHPLFPQPARALRLPRAAGHRVHRAGPGIAGIGVLFEHD